MPYILRHQATGEVAAAFLRNKYDLAYWGVRWWEVSSEAEQAAAAAGDSGWSVAEVTDSRLKIMNVKLNNDPNRRLFIDEQGSIRIDTGSAR